MMLRLARDARMFDQPGEQAMSTNGDGDGRANADQAAQRHFEARERMAAAIKRGIAERIAPTPPRPIERGHAQGRGLTPDEMIAEQQAIAEAARVRLEAAQAKTERLEEMFAAGQEWLM